MEKTLETRCAVYDCCATGFLPPSLIAVNTEVQRRIDAKQTAKQEQQPAQQQQQQHSPLEQRQPDTEQPDCAPPTPLLTGSDVPASMLSSDSIAPELVLAPSLMTSSSISSDMSSAGSSPVQRLQLGSRFPAALSDTELVKLGGAGSDASQASYDSTLPVVALPPQVFEALGAIPPGQQKPGKKSKREKARGLLSSFTGGYVYLRPDFTNP